MNWNQTLRTSWSAVRSHGLRSTLTVLGILIGIAAVILTVGLGIGSQQEVSAKISSLGSNLLIVTPGSSTSAGGIRGGFGSSSTLTRADATALASATNAPDISAVAAEKSTSVIRSSTIVVPTWTAWACICSISHGPCTASAKPG